jgi:hypothetical protein
MASFSSVRFTTTCLIGAFSSRGRRRFPKSLAGSTPCPAQLLGTGPRIKLVKNCYDLLAESLSHGPAHRSQLPETIS